MTSAVANLIPFGFMAESFHGKVPDSPPRWARKVLSFSMDHIWPAWDHANGGWIGDSAAHMLEITRFDLAAIANLSSKLGDQPSYSNGNGPQTHGGLFEAEDNLMPRLRPNWRTAREYGIDVALERRLQWILGCGDNEAIRLAAEFGSGMSDVSAGLFWLKWQLQRPRAHQAAFLMGGMSVTPLQKLAYSAWSPSAISGHALQGLSGCLYVVRASPSSNSELFSRLAVDIGDRRVFAGVHYPTDNLLSWYSAWEFVVQQGEDGIWTSQETKAAHDFLHAAVKTSAVLEQLRHHPRYAAWQGVMPNLLPV